MPKRKNLDDKKNIKSKKKASDDNLIMQDDFLELDEAIDEIVIEEVEDDTEFISKVKEFEKQHKNAKLINVFNLIGKPVFGKTKKLNSNKLKTEYKKLILLLDKNNIIVHFQSDYPLEEKYRFITEEIFKQDVEKNQHISFIYEDFHPEMIEEDDEEILII